ncbi:hypothetical protein TSUD_315100 [Trifolium subterraneum]|uniref:Protein kinase domain-containing protein n=1 Tax=Trifolium subterraneum TaxID=3900 RepID=A0A2Z6MHV5_TRISU|nr:hypothetical protein TSUD_315100 [Trifolium subterraneum]
MVTLLNAEGTNVFEPDEEDVANVFGNLRGMCQRKVVTVKEAVVDDNDVVKGLLDFANKNLVHSIVIGASKNPLPSLKKFKAFNDTPTTVMKSAPDYCSVYVISKLKIVSARSAIRSMANQTSPINQLPFQVSSQSEFENGIRSVLPRTGDSNEASESRSFDSILGTGKGSTRERPRSAGSNQSLDVIDTPGGRGRQWASMDEREMITLAPIVDVNGDLDLLDSYGTKPSNLTSQELEAEMKRLRRELKQTMDMYSSACKQAISAKNQAEQIRQWKLEGEKKAVESRMSQEAALAMAEREKARAKAALEAAEEAKRKAEQEAQRRREVEMKARKEAEERDRVLTALAQKDNRYRKYTMQEIEVATEKFSPSKKLGEGGYGPVLEDRLFRRQNSKPLSWQKRFQIAAEIGTALLFLHQTKPEPIVHRDLKPSNILLDKNYVSKISDVGLARLVPPSVADNVTQYYMTSAAGTLCYIDPEYQQTGILTTQSDVYSLGIMLLQIITAKPPMGLAHHVKKAIENDQIEEILDPVVTDWPVEAALSFAKLALSCTELSKKDRPSLATVVLPELNRLRDLGDI